MKEKIEDFERNIGKILRMAVHVEDYLEFFISDYFVKPQNAKTFFLNDIIVSKLNFEQKKHIFKEICEREQFEKKEVKKIIKSIEFVQQARNRVAHWEAERLSDGTFRLRNRKSFTTAKDVQEINKMLVESVDKERLKAIRGIGKFHCIYQKEGTIDEKKSIEDF